MYIPEEAIDYAMNHGYTVTLDPDSGPSMQNGERRIWRTRDGFMTADLKDGSYTSHKKFPSVMDALRRPFNDPID